MICKRDQEKMKRGRWDDSDEDTEQKKKKQSHDEVKRKQSSSRKGVKQDSVSLKELEPSTLSTSMHPRPALREYKPLVPACRSTDNYEKLNFIDQGTYGMVFRARCVETKEVYALKQVKFGGEIGKIGFPYTALREINILLTLKHPNIINVREVVADPSSDSVFMVMEYCENDLKTCMKQNRQSFSIAEVIY